MNFNDLISFVGMPIESIGFERGLALRSTEQGWFTHAGSKTGSVLIDPDTVMVRFAPVLVRCRIGPQGHAITLLLHPNGGFAPQVPSHTLILHHRFQGTAISYMADALVYHVNALHARYENARDDCKDISLIPGVEFTGKVGLQDHPEPYYEFDALLAVARRAYDTCRYVLWKTFSAKRGSIPTSFEKTVPLCTNLDPAIRDDLQSSWDNWGSLLTSYRDCIMHYVPIDFGLATLSLEQELPGIWTASARIPDNPEARSKTNFTFKKGLDALTYGWHLANEIVRVLRIVVDAAAQIESSKPPN